MWWTNRWHTTMSMFNEDIICQKCKKEEKDRPDYKLASDADNSEIRKGNYNFKGIGYDKLEESNNDKQWWSIYAGLSGGFGGSHYVEKFYGTNEEAEKYAWEQACEEYESLAGMHGLRTIEEIMEEDELDYDDAEMTYNDERESWIDYEAKPFEESHVNENSFVKYVSYDIQHLNSYISSKKPKIRYTFDDVNNYNIYRCSIDVDGEKLDIEVKKSIYIPFGTIANIGNYSQGIRKGADKLYMTMESLYKEGMNECVELVEGIKKNTI